MNTTELPDLHDAVVVDISLNIAAQNLSIGIEYYVRATDSKRVRGLIEFSDVATVSQNVVLNELIRNRSAGNVTYWIPSAAVGDTFIYFAHGYMQVHAAAPRLRELLDDEK
jgi:hypothetical protein